MGRKEWMENAKTFFLSSGIMLGTNVSGERCVFPWNGKSASVIYPLFSLRQTETG